MPESMRTPCTGRAGLNGKLGPYLDGELDPRAQNEVRAHLALCPACQAELEELRSLTLLLRAAPQPAFTPALDFKAQFMLQLPRREALPAAQADSPETDHPGANGRLLSWLAPVLVLAVWIFIQVTLNLSGAVSIANQVGLLDGSAAWANSDPQQMLWFTAAQSTLGAALNPQSQNNLQALNDAGLFIQNLLVLMLWQVGIALLYWGALTLVWRGRIKTWWTSITAE